MGWQERLFSLGRNAGDAAASSARAGRIAELAAEAAKARSATPSGFRTARAGSSYELMGDGTTMRRKVATEWHPDHQDAGAKDRSSATYYLAPEGARLAQRAYASGRSPISGSALTRLEVIEGRPHLLVMQFERDPTTAARGLPGRPVKELGYAQVPLDLADGPQVGASPLEFFQDGKFHLGSEISEIY